MAGPGPEKHPKKHSQVQVSKICDILIPWRRISEDWGNFASVWEVYFSLIRILPLIMVIVFFFKYFTWVPINFGHFVFKQKSLMESGDATLTECRICQEEDSKENMENPCAYSGTLKVWGLGFRR